MSNDVQSNVIKFGGKGKNLLALLPQEPELLPVPWHIHEATWILREVSKLEEDFLNPWEIEFALSMATQRFDASPKQRACLKRIGDKVEAATRPPPASDNTA